MATKPKSPTNLHGHNAPWMFPVWGLIGFVGLNSLLYLGSAQGLFIITVFTITTFTLLAKNKDSMPITIRPDEYEYFQKLRQADPECYELLKTQNEYFAKQVAEFEYVEAKRLEQASKTRKNTKNLNVARESWVYQ